MKRPAPTPSLVLAPALAVALVCSAPALHGQDAEVPAPPAPVAAQEAFDPASLGTRLEATRGKLAAVPADAAPDSAEGQRKTVWERQVALLEELSATLAARSEYQLKRQQLEERAAAAERARNELEGAADPTTKPGVPPEASATALEQAQASLAQQQQVAAGARQALADNQTRLEAIPAEVAAARARGEEALPRIAALQVERDAATGDGQRALAELRLENASLEQQAAVERVETLRAEETLRKAQEPVLALELDVADLRLGALEQQVAVLAEAVGQQLEREQKTREAEVARREREAERADTPPERYLAVREAELARSERNQSELQAFLVTLKNEVNEQEKRLLAEKDELTQLRDFVERSGTTGRTGERIKDQHKRLPKRRLALERSLLFGLTESLGEYRARRFDIEDLLYAMNDSWPAEREKIAAALDPAESRDFLARAAELRDRYRAALRDEKSLITEVVSLGPSLQRAHLARLENLDALDRFLLSQLFRVRDGAPLGPTTLTPLADEMKVLAGWAGDLAASRGTLASALSGAKAIALGVLLFPVLPALLFWLRNVVRSFVRSRNQHTLDHGGGAWNQVLALAGGIVAAGLLPSYLFAASRVAGVAGLPPHVGPVLSNLLSRIALIVFLWLLARSLFSGRSTAHVQLGMNLDAAHALYRALRLLLAGWLLLLVPWSLLLDAPFELVALPRLLYSAFALIGGFALLRVLRPGSPFVQRAVARRKKGFATRSWKVIYFVVVVTLLTIIGLDAFGYRYGAQQLARAFGLTLLTLLLLPPLHMLMSDAARTIARRRALSRTEADEEEVEPALDESRLGGFLRVIFVLVGVLTLAEVWGLDDQAIRTLDEIQVYSIRAEGGELEWVSVADLLFFTVILVGSIWVLKLIPSLYELLIFPRFRLDAGLRYAIVTISQYVIFLIAVIVALSAIHLDLGRLGWLIAAMGVGLGFGLQEIVSNFVSGIILLLERPVRVGDIVTIGSTSGTIRKINIRATTLMNFDQQEVIVPNRQFITSEVTNWTGSNRILRLVIPIGVAYGTDVDGVTEALAAILKQEPEALDTPEPAVLFTGHGESSLDFEVRVFVADPSRKMALQDKLNKQINKEFARRGYEIPFPQRDLHIRSTPVDPAELAGGATRDADEPQAARPADAKSGTRSAPGREASAPP